MAAVLQLASASGNAFAYLWEDEAGPGFDGPRWARALGRPGQGLALDGLFLLARPRPGTPWKLEHWDSDGSATFCSNGTRAAVAVAGAPEGSEVGVRSNGLPVLLRRDEDGIGLRLPEGEGFGLQPVTIGCPFPHAYGWIGNPQLVIEHPDVAGLDLAAFAPPLRHHRALPQGANVNAVQVEGEGRVRIRSWERGVEGETLCCGTGCAVAGAWLASRTGRLRWTFSPAGPDPVTVALDGIEGGAWRGLWLSGPVRRTGTLSLELPPHPPGAGR
jgi:diaminopimelate epimerase